MILWLLLAPSRELKLKPVTADHDRIALWGIKTNKKKKQHCQRQ